MFTKTKLFIVFYQLNFSKFLWDKILIYKSCQVILGKVILQYTFVFSHSNSIILKRTFVFLHCNSIILKRTLIFLHCNSIILRRTFVFLHCEVVFLKSKIVFLKSIWPTTLSSSMNFGSPNWFSFLFAAGERLDVECVRRITGRLLSPFQRLDA